MHLPSLLGTSTMLLAIGLLCTGDSRMSAAPLAAGSLSTASASPGVPSTLATPETPEAPAETPDIANGHYVLVVEGDRNALVISHARRKADPWAGVPKGFASSWQLTVRDGRGAVLAEVPLDVSPFATGAAQVGQPVQVQGCVVRDARIGMLVNVPRFATAASYEFQRDGAAGRPVVIGTIAGNQIRELAGEQR